MPSKILFGMQCPRELTVEMSMSSKGENDRTSDD
jgi:hypothetical protein